MIFDLDFGFMKVRLYEISECISYCGLRHVYFYIQFLPIA